MATKPTPKSQQVKITRDLITKAGTINEKIDPVAALLDACYAFDLSEGRIERER